ncbi:MAG: ATP-binding protein [Thermoplasmata archaeon]|nr:ATP-binding protein [Candidatus Sysuiplasma jiujiangense]
MAIILTVIIARKQCEHIRQATGWIFIYGRRKTGKTFLARHCSDFDDYYFVTRDRTIIDNEGMSISEETLRAQLGRSSDRVVVIDEFHRLGPPFLDFLHFLPQNGKLLILSSTLWLSKKLLSHGSPILGKFKEFNISLIDLDDVLGSLRGSGRFRLEISIFLREPLAIKFYDENVSDALEFATNVITGSMNTVPALVGEIFSEEGRILSRTYEAIISAIASKHYVSSEISSVLFSRKLIDKDDPSLIQPYLNNLLRMGLIRRLKVFARNRYQYRVSSPLAATFYYLNEKYGIAERDVRPSEIRGKISELLPLLVEDEVRSSIAAILGMEEQVAESVNADGIFFAFEKPRAALEVKWRERVDISRVEEAMKDIDVQRKILFVPDKKGLKSNSLEIWDVGDLMNSSHG